MTPSELVESWKRVHSRWDDPRTPHFPQETHCIDIEVARRLALDLATATQRTQALWAALATVLDQIDYTASACSPTEMVGACLPTSVIRIAREALGKPAVPGPAGGSDVAGDQQHDQHD
jgi:hypothetical protein